MFIFDLLNMNKNSNLKKNKNNKQCLSTEKITPFLIKPILLVFLAPPRI